MSDPFSMNVAGVQNLISSGENKTPVSTDSTEAGEPIDIYELDLSNEDLLKLDQDWKSKSSAYSAKIKTRQDKNKKYYLGMDIDGGASPVGSNVIFESEETFIPQALAQNPEPVVWSDNTDMGKDESNKVKTMLQYHADVLALRRILGITLRHWSVYFTGIVKHGWDKKQNDITLDVRNPRNFILDPEGYIDVKGNYVGDFLGEKINSTAKDLIDLYPDKKDIILAKVDNKLGTKVTRTEWWTNEYCFTTFNEEVLDKHKNEFFNYPQEEEGLGEYGEDIKTSTPGINHFAHPIMPYTFLSVFTFQEAPHDVTNLIEQNIANQDRIVDRDLQIDKNLRSGNNSLLVDPTFADQETAREIAKAIEGGDPVLVDPKGVQRMPASALPNGILQSLEIDKDTLRSTFGVQGLAPERQTGNTTARGMILNQAHDATRIGGGVGSALEQMADTIFNWWLQMYYVFYDENHYGAVLGNGAAVDYVEMNMSNPNRHFVVSVMPDSMKPKDEITEQNQAIELANKGWLDPINLYKRLNDPDPMNTAKMAAMWKINPMQYMATFFPETQPANPLDSANTPNPLDMAGVPAESDGSLGAPPASPSLASVPLTAGASNPQL